jgi:hypothetical protein
MTNKTIEQIEKVGYAYAICEHNEKMAHCDICSEPQDVSCDEILELRKENKTLKLNLEKIASHFDDHSTVSHQAKTLKRMARVYLNRLK